MEETTTAVPSLSSPPPKTSTASEAAVAVLSVSDAVIEGQGGPGLVEDAAPAEAADGRPVGDRQVGDGHGRVVADVEDPTGVVAADGQPVLAGAGDAQVAGDAQRAAGQADGAMQIGTEGDGVGPRVGVGVEDRLA